MDVKSKLPWKWLPRKLFVEATSMEAFVEAFVQASGIFFSVEASTEAVKSSMEAFMNFHAKRK